MGELKLGMIGWSEGNGHPFSFSSIINGYSDAALAASGWDGIYNYVRRRDPSEFGIANARITHAWSQNEDWTRALCSACKIPNVAQHPEDMIAEIDAVIIARDDFENHLGLAMPFLESGLSVFVDKPLALDPSDLLRFLPFLKSGKLMSCSGLRYASELDELRAGLVDYGKLRLIRAAVVNSWERYGVHLLEAVFSILQDREPRWVQAIKAEHMAVSVGFDDGLLMQIDTLGEVPFTFQVDVWGTDKASTHHIRDNFTMFRRMLWHFIRSVETGVPAVPPEHTLRIMTLLRAGRVSRSENRKVDFHELELQEDL